MHIEAHNLSDRLFMELWGRNQASEQGSIVDVKYILVNNNINIHHDIDIERVNIIRIGR